MTASADERSGAFWGRRKGKRLRAGQETRLETSLPRLAVPAGPSPMGLRELRALFAHEPNRLILEIGFGGGEHLADMARRNPDAGLVGCEPFVNGMAKMLARIEEEGLENVRLWDRDATELLPRLPDAAFERVYLLYPDPWPKRRQRKRRFVSPAVLGEIVRILAPGGQFRFASDIDDYVGWTLARARDCAGLEWLASGADDWRRPFADWPGTRYEAKALREGRVPSYLTFARI